MKDIYFDKDKFYKNKRVRLRKKDIYYPEKKSYAIYTEKSPTIQETIQIADEIEKKADFKKTYAKLKKDGIVCEFILNVARYKFMNCTVEFREVLNLMNYIEIEGPTKKDIKDVMNILNIKGNVLTEGALNRLLRLTGLSKIEV